MFTAFVLEVYLNVDVRRNPTLLHSFDLNVKTLKSYVDRAISRDIF